MPDIGHDYPNSTIQFRDRLGNPADIDTSTKALTVELSAGADLVTIDNIQRQGAGLGAFTVAVKTLGTGAVAGDIVADKDMTPEGESELRVPFAFVIDPLEATGAALTLSGGVEK